MSEEALQQTACLHCPSHSIEVLESSEQDGILDHIRPGPTELIEQLTLPTGK